jgi:hypothetical protein
MRLGYGKEEIVAVYVVTWNLNKEGAAYQHARTAFLNQLAKFENVADPGLDSVRFISTMNSASEISDFLRYKLDGNDCLFVSKLASGTQDGWMAQATWNWINARL